MSTAFKTGCLRKTPYGFDWLSGGDGWAQGMYHPEGSPQADYHVNGFELAKRRWLLAKVYEGSSVFLRDCMFNMVFGLKFLVFNSRGIFILTNFHAPDFHLFKKCFVFDPLKNIASTCVASGSMEYSLWFQYPYHPCMVYLHLAVFFYGKLLTEKTWRVSVCGFGIDGSTSISTTGQNGPVKSCMLEGSWLQKDAFDADDMAMIWNCSFIQAFFSHKWIHSQDFTTENLFGSLTSLIFVLYLTWCWSWRPGMMCHVYHTMKKVFRGGLVPRLHRVVCRRWGETSSRLYVIP